jgi:hypothetical protein
MENPPPKLASWIIIIGIFVGICLSVVVVLAVAQILPYGRDHTNPEVVSEPTWDSEQTRTLAKKACFDCHSNETVWPWYSNLAPLSWVIQRDVDEGRKRLNFSDWSSPHELELDELQAIVEEGEMPPGEYLLLHPGARLTADETTQLVDGLTKTLSR